LKHEGHEGIKDAKRVGSAERGDIVRDVRAFVLS
jgi:hypothetical protein